MKDYKKILKGVVNIINTTEKSDIGFANICTYISENCPELCESEDERIRKALVKQFSDYKRRGENHGFGYSNDKILDWLERQEEKEYGWSEESYDDARLNDIVSKVEYGLQLNKAEINWLKSIKERLHEEIHYWTEEEIEPIISDYLRGTEHYGGMIGRLRCLKPKSPERQDEQEAWSEEDKNMLEWIIGYLDNRVLNAPISEERTACKNAIAWLKSLRPQNRWKPSYEQVSVLEFIMEGIEKDSIRYAVLNSILEQLMKLREE